MACPITQDQSEMLAGALFALAESIDDFVIAARIRDLAERYLVIAKVLEIQSEAAPTFH